MNTKVVLITGVSSGIGKAAAELFAQNGWQVIGTARQLTDSLPQHANIALKTLDVTQEESIHQLFTWVEQTYGHLDVVVNNAGFGLFGAFETCSEEDIQQQYEVNVFGLMRMTREAVRVMRKQGNGTIVQISSMGGRFSLPLYSIYNSTKFAVEGFTEGLFYEVEQFGIKVKLVEPGPIKTDFYSRSKKVGTHTAFTTIYDSLSNQVWDNYQKAGITGRPPEDVATVVWKAATSHNKKLRYPVGWEIKLNLLGVKLGSFAGISGIMKRRTMSKSN